jgi:hypothetical protein
MAKSSGIFDGLQDGQSREKAARHLLQPLRSRLRDLGGELTQRRARGSGCLETFKCVCYDLPVEALCIH